MRKVFLNFFILTFFTVSVLACGSSKTTGNEPAVEAGETVGYGTDSGPDQEPKCPGPKWGSDSVSNVQNFSFYRNHYKNGNYDEAYKYWTHVYKNAPKASLNIYVNGTDIIEYKIEQATDDAEKNAFIDTLMMLYDQRIACFGNKGEVLGRKGVNLIKVKPQAYNEAYEILEESIKLEGNNTLFTVPYIYTYTVAKKYEDKDLDVGQVLNKYTNTMKIIDHNIQQGQGVENWQKIKDAVTKLVEPLLSCEDLVNYYQGQMQQKQPTPDELEAWIASLSAKNCTENTLFPQLSERLFKVRPNAAAARAVAKTELGKKNYNKAIEYYNRAAELEKDNVQKAEDLLSIAAIYRDLKDCSSSRTYAQRAAQTRGNWGKPYILLGDLYVTCASNCEDGFKRKTVYWLAVDQYIKARNIDNSVSEEAGKRISTYSQFFPTLDEVFFQGLKEGSSYNVECWPNETTTVRPK